MVALLTDAEKVYFKGARNGLELDPDLTIDKWADEYRILSTEGSAEPGPWRTSRTPYMREIMVCLSPSHPCKRVVFQKGSQIAGTECLNNWIGFVIHLAPGPFLMVQPTVDLAKKISKQRIATAIRDTPVLNERVRPARERDSGNTVLVKEFMGGVLIMTGANSAAGLRSMPVRYLGLDEVDSYPSDLEGEGDPVAIAEKRTLTFARRKIFILSTPTIKFFSRIEREFDHSDQRYFNVHCPHCGERQVLLWRGIKFEHDNKYTLQSDVSYACKHCGALIEERYKTTMFENGIWIPENPEGLYPGFHLSGLYSPLGWLSWEDIVLQFLDFKKKKDINLQKTWTNTVLAETFDIPGEVVEYTHLFNRREKFSEKLNKDIVVLTAAIDTQDDRIEITIVGWARHEESYVIEAKVIYGDLSKPDIWKDLDMFLDKTYIHEKGLMKIQCSAIDTGGHYTNEVYEYVKSRQFKKVYAIKGANVSGLPIVTRPSKQKGGFYLFRIGTDTAKDLLFNRLKINEPGPGYIHFSMTLDEEYFRQLTAEKTHLKYNRGFPKRVWVKIRDRNEALDEFVYAISALYILALIYYPNYTVTQMLDHLASQIEKAENVEHNQETGKNKESRSRVINKGVEI